MDREKLVDAFAIVLNEAYGLSLVAHVSDPNGTAADRYANQAEAVLHLAHSLGVRREVQERLEELRAA